MSAKCKRCEKTAYSMESIKYDKFTYHQTCFKCQNCKCNLIIATVAQFNGELYCKNCFVRMFKTQGNYKIFSGEPASPTSGQTATLPSPTSSGTTETEVTETTSS